MPVEQPESLKTVAAYSVLLTSEKDRSDFLQVLRAAASEHGMHVDADSHEELEAMARGVPEARMTIHAAIWKGASDKESVAGIMDMGHLHDAWITFSKGGDPQFNIRFRVRVMREIMRRWPDTLSLPVLPTGGLPLHGDLVQTPHGYIINPSAASKYASERPKP